ncbi:hypothetical protein BSL78_00760 [Apostichopus japonicus]|uniref:Galaxin-like repeats domain-containing protein n=1 Tax=Stichopus japonicus TaxID=307972 RepID=A0A2G8LPZ1_STIJA|nr:hypothetical protein BSL78_00760 [Apostichopus japonicus]
MVALRLDSVTGTFGHKKFCPPKLKWSRLQCCGEHYIDPATDTCCSEQVVHGVGECCGRNTIFNSLEEACFGGKLYPIPEGHDAWLYNICELNDGTIGLYYAKTHMCCNGEVMSKSGNLRCHGNVEYDITTDIVVHGVGGLQAVQIEDGRTSRCGLEMLNPNREVCCNGQVHDVGSADGACCNHKPYSRHNASCCRDVITEGVPEIAGIQECSEEQSYWNSASISCQLGVVLDSYAEVQCCGNEVLSITDQICCAGKILTRTGPDDICCGTEILKPNAFCVEGRIVLKETHEDSYCLLRNDTFRIERIITYDSNAYICKDGALAVKKPNQRYCEGAKTIYDVQTEICCGHIRVHKNTNPWGLERRCCGYGVYHPQEQSCYGYHVFQIPERFAEICSLSLYDSRTEVCINDHIYSRTTTELTIEMCRKSNNLAAAFDQHCCQGKPISDRTHIAVMTIRVVDLNALEAVCCEGSWHFTGGEAKSCIGAVAVAKRERLCGDTIYLRADGQCCGNGIYNPRTHLCCDGVR